MEGTARYAPVIDHISTTLPAWEFMLVDIGCSGGSLARTCGRRANGGGGTGPV